MSRIYLVILILCHHAYSQQSINNLRKATADEIKEIVPDSLYKEVKKQSEHVSPFIEAEITETILLEKYKSSKTQQELDQTKDEFKLYYQKMVNQGFNKDDLIKTSNKMTLDLYDDVIKQNSEQDSQLKADIAKKQNQIIEMYDKHYNKWEHTQQNSNLDSEDLTSKITDEKRKQYKTELSVLMEKESALNNEIKDLLSKSKTLQEGSKRAQDFQSFLKEIVTDLDYTKAGSQKEDLQSPQFSKIDLYVPSEFNLEKYKLSKSTFNEDLSIFSNQNSISPLCYKSTTTSNDMTLFLSDGNDVIKKLEEKEQRELKGKFYFSWGYNRAWHSKSDVTFTTSEGTFTIHDAHGDDRPSPFDPKIYFNPATLSIPQYNLKLGYEFNDKWSIEAGTDHMKWVFDNKRRYNITGHFEPKVVIENPDSQHGWDAVHAVDFEHAKELGDASWLGFEHSDGYNYVHVSGVFNQRLLETKKKIFAIDTQIAGGVGLMVPKTKVNMHRDQAWNWVGLDNRFHVAGAGAHADARLKITFFDRVYIQGVTRGNAIKVKNALVNTETDPTARLEHTPIYSGQVSVEIGAKFPIYKKKKK